MQSDNVKWKDHNVHTIIESSEKGGETVDSGRQTSCSSPISSSEDHSNNDKHIYAIARCTANIASLPGRYCCLNYITSIELINVTTKSITQCF